MLEQWEWHIIAPDGKRFVVAKLTDIQSEMDALFFLYGDDADLKGVAVRKAARANGQS